MGAAVLVVLAVLGALAIGLLLGRYYVPDDRMLRRTARQSRTYMRTVMHLIARDRDAAIVELRKVVEENVDDIEPYFALGSLFRARGEHERAIRVHQALALREKDQRTLRMRAMFELALDFRAAGMPRRATRALEEVIDDEPGHVEALRAVAALYEEQGHFEQAGTTVIALAEADGAQFDRVGRAHALFVAAAQVAIADGELDQARELLKKARHHADDNAHFLVAAGELAAARGNYSGARERWWGSLRLAPGLAPLIVEKLAALPAGNAGIAAEPTVPSDPTNHSHDLVSAPAHLGSDVVAELAKLQLELGPRIELVLAQARFIVTRDQPAQDALQTTLKLLTPEFVNSVPAQVIRAKLALGGTDPVAQHAALEALVADAGPLAWATGEAWRCNACGTRVVRYAWRCEHCRRWATLMSAVAIEPALVPRSIETPRDRRTQLRPAANLTALGLPTPSVDGLPRTLTDRPSVLRRASAWLNRRSRRANAEKKRISAD